MLCSVWLVGAKYVDQVLDSLYVLENAMRHFYIRAEMGSNMGRKKEEVDEDYKQAAALAAMVAPYRHARLSAMKLAGDPNAPKDLEDSASLEELKAMVEFHLERVAPVLDLEVIPKARIANQLVSGVNRPTESLCQSVPPSASVGAK